MDTNLEIRTLALAFAAIDEAEKKATAENYVGAEVFLGVSKAASLAVIAAQLAAIRNQLTAYLANGR